MDQLGDDVCNFDALFYFGRSKKDTFAFIKDHIWKINNSLRDRLLPMVGKEVVIKSVM